ncbi:MAG: biopolymer transporter ExbD [Pseudomonadales bacterium]|nr:biopolymer transporter ExbD [Pseudomonadales bacterium]
MAFGARKRRSGDLDIDIDLVPIMNMFLVLIPFLLMSSSFMSLKAINTSVPVSSEAAQQSVAPPKKSPVKIKAMIELNVNGISLVAEADELNPEALQKMALTLKKRGKAYPLEQLSQHLASIKQQYPLSDTVVLMPAAKVTYKDIVKAMDAARSLGQLPLFKHVVLASKAG